jgi:hypothetical protein
MKNIISVYMELLCVTFLLSANCFGQTGPAIPHLQKQGTVTQLIVGGKPFMVLGGELGNNAATSMEAMKPLWPRLLS